MPWIDLHTHSTFSDGALSPSQLIDLALKRSVSALALTDHDTVAGIPAFFSYAADKPLQVIAGIEISAWHGNESLHILGYGLDHTARELNLALAELQQARHQRNLEILRQTQRTGH
jgi:3',5'-nucleoside bisphosphate phosphatase